MRVDFMTGNTTNLSISRKAELEIRLKLDEKTGGYYVGKSMET